MAGLAPMGVVLRELEIRVGGMLPLTCILDGYVVYSFGPEREDVAVGDGDGGRQAPQANEQKEQTELDGPRSGESEASKS